MTNNMPLAFFIITVFFIQTLLPSGFMPSFGKDGTVTITICSIEGEKSIDISKSDLPNSSENGHTSNNANQVCEYAVLASGDVISSDLSFSQASYDLQKVNYFRNEFLFAGRSLSSVYQSRAPPSFILFS